MSTSKTPSALPEVQANGAASKSADWHHLCERLLEEREQLVGRIALLTSENKQLKKSLGHLLFEDIPFDKEELLGLASKGPSFEELIAELEHQK